jgi:hypothetical protein
VVRWSAAVSLPLAVTLEAMQDPGRRIVAYVAAPRGTPVALADGLGSLDSVLVPASGTALLLAPTAGAVTMRGGGDTVAVAVPAARPQKGVVLLGAAGWEAKFVIAALEEIGWRVDAELAVAPGVRVVQGQPVPLDTTRHAVVIALDSAAAERGGAIGRFVAHGGGAVLGAGAARVAPLRRLAAGGVGERVRPRALRFAADAGRRALPVSAVAPLAAGAVVLERSDGLVAVAARRAGVGRVLQVGYDDTWRWRMQGDDQAPAAHRECWGRLVAAAAGGGSATGAAPLAQAVGALGPAAAPEQAPRPSLRIEWWPFVATALVLSLLGEWTSRRLRGAV